MRLRGIPPLRTLSILVVLGVPSCANKADVETRITGIETRVSKVEANQTEIRTSISGDSITSWIYALGSVGAAVFYPLIIRPLRLRKQRRNGYHESPV